MSKTSKQAAEFGDMLDAIRNAARKCDGEPLDFIADLHEAGFMVVSADAVIADTVMAYIGNADEHITSLLNEDNRPPAAVPSNKFEIRGTVDMIPEEADRFIEWWQGVRRKGAEVDDRDDNLSTLAWATRWRAGMDAHAAIVDADIIPF